MIGGMLAAVLPHRIFGIAKKVKLGGITDGPANAHGDLHFLKMPHVSGEAWEMISKAQKQAEATTGLCEKLDN